MKPKKILKVLKQLNSVVFILIFFKPKISEDFSNAQNYEFFAFYFSQAPKINSYLKK